jgi:3-hydroxybutyryl-CoA dehydrogenase
VSEPAGVTEPAAVIGVLGAGTMGSGIAQLACLAGARTLLHDPVAEALDRGAGAVGENLDRGAQRGRWSEQEAREAAQRLQPAGDLRQLASCELVIEAAPESLELKHQLFSSLSEIVDERCVLATNTSSLSVTAIASAASNPGRVVGMHFFNPAPLMRLLEVVAGEASDERSLALARATGEAMGKRVIDAADGPGFLVNRCNRPFGLEALRLVGEHLADVEQVDRIMRLGGGFRMGPFELSDLVGVDVGFEISKSFYAQSFGEPRWRPSLVAQRMVDAGRFGRKAGRGYYRYGEGPHRPEDPEPPAAGGGDGLIVIAGAGRLAEELREAAADAGWDARAPEEADEQVPTLALDCGGSGDGAPLQGGPQALLCDRGSLAAMDPNGSSVGFYVLPPLAETRLVELTRGPGSSQLAIDASERFFASLGKHVEWVGDAPGLVLGRIVCQLINEAAFAVGEGVGSAADIDAGMVLGLNHPRGPLEWADTVGLDHVLEVLQALSLHYEEERYRTAPLLRRLWYEGATGRDVGAGFHRYPQAS